MRRYAIIVHNLDHARAATRTAAEAGVSLELWSAPDASSYLGAAVFREIVDAARSEISNVDVLGVMDCGKNPGYALEAFRHGIKSVSIDLPVETQARLGDIAKQCGAAILESLPNMLDLLDCQEPEDACRHWFSKTANCSSALSEPKLPRNIASCSESGKRVNRGENEP
jgi:hypothetical protein